MEIDGYSHIVGLRPSGLDIEPGRSGEAIKHWPRRGFCIGSDLEGEKTPPMRESQRVRGTGSEEEKML